MSNVYEIPKKINQDALKMIKEISSQIESGEVTGFTIAVEFDDGTYMTMGSSTMSRLQTSGILLDMAIRRLDKDDL